MNSIVVAGIVFASALGGALFGMLLQRVLPEKYLQHETKDIVRLGTGLIATMAALILGLLVSSAKSSFDEESNSFRELALNVVLLDRKLAHFGDEAAPARAQLKRTVEQTLDSLWPEQAPGQGAEQVVAKSPGIDDRKITAEGAATLEALRQLPAHDDMQKMYKTEALQLSSDLAKDRWRLSQSTDGSLPPTFLVVLAFWLSVLFGSFGLFSPRNLLAFAALVVCAASVAGAVFLIVDLDQPLDGLVRVSSSSLRDALSKLGT
jgi:hypothetical protein